MSKKVFYCNKIKTLCPEFPSAEAIVVSDGRIEFIGTKDEILSYIYIYIEALH